MYILVGGPIKKSIKIPFFLYLIFMIDLKLSPTKEGSAT
jgi:hypothetical protein